MTPTQLATSYNKIASQWEADMAHASYGVSMVDKALRYCSHKQTALDVGCGSGGRITDTLTTAGFTITGVDISHKMLALAKAKHPEVRFELADITIWESHKKFDFIIAWDSIFHLPLKSQKPVLEKLCDLLRPDGILLYTFGNAIGEHTDTWHNEPFYYSSLGITENLKIIANAACECKHLELDQYPEKHVSMIVQKNAS